MFPRTLVFYITVHVQQFLRNNQIITGDFILFRRDLQGPIENLILPILVSNTHLRLSFRKLLSSTEKDDQYFRLGVEKEVSRTYWLFVHDRRAFTNTEEFHILTCCKLILFQTSS